MNREEIEKLLEINPRALVDLVVELFRQIEELEIIIKKDSHNSSKPPSSDMIRKPKLKNLREKQGRKPG